MSHQLLVLVLLLTTWAEASVTGPGPTCPGVAGSRCALECQQRLCSSLSSFFRGLNGSSWNNNRGWEVAARCAASAAAAAGADPARPPPYCGWYGITCCNRTEHARPKNSSDPPPCPVLGGVFAVQLPFNNLTRQLASPEVEGALLQLSACGLQRLELPSNQLTGN